MYGIGWIFLPLTLLLSFTAAAAEKVTVTTGYTSMVEAKNGVETVGVVVDGYVSEPQYADQVVFSGIQEVIELVLVSESELGTTGRTLAESIEAGQKRYGLCAPEMVFAVAANYPDAVDYQFLVLATAYLKGSNGTPLLFRFFEWSWHPSDPNEGKHTIGLVVASRKDPESVYVEPVFIFCP